MYLFVAFSSMLALSTSISIESAQFGTRDASGRCGPDYGSCSLNQCCSFAGWCGTTEEYCEAPDCQTAYGPACDANKIPQGTNTSDIPRNELGSIPYGGDGIYDCVEPQMIAITFDDGPYKYTDHVLDLLAEHNATATFMITGNNNGKGEIDNSSLPWASKIKRMYAEGHQICSHTWSHANLDGLTSHQRKNEMWKNEMALRNILGFFPTYMRPPYSACSAGCEEDMKKLGYHIIYYDIDTQDWMNDNPNLIQKSKDIFTQSLASVSGGAAKNDWLVIAHDIHFETAYNLTSFMLRTAKAQGYRVVTLGECLGDPKENWYRSG